jgi:hypothetical protein
MLVVDATKFNFVSCVHAKSNRLLHKCAKNYRITNNLDAHKNPEIDPLIQFRVDLPYNFILITPLQKSY